MRGISVWKNIHKGEQNGRENKNYTSKPHSHHLIISFCWRNYQNFHFDNFAKASNWPENSNRRIAYWSLESARDRNLNKRILHLIWDFFHLDKEGFSSSIFQLVGSKSDEAISHLSVHVRNQSLKKEIMTLDVVWRNLGCSASISELGYFQKVQKYK